MDDTARMLKAHDMDGLEKAAAKVRESREALVSGRWLLSVFYLEVWTIPSDEKGAQAAIDFLRSWVHQRPDSITARVCLARALVNYAWNAHPNSGNEQNAAAWRVYNDRIAEAWDVLQQASLLKEKCPGWYEAAQGVALAQPWETGRFLALTEQAIKETPTYNQYYQNAERFLSPGARGDLAKWIAAQANTFPAPEGDLKYANFVWLADTALDSNSMSFAPGYLDWPRTQRGLEAWLRKMPNDPSLLSEYTRLAVMANDRETAHRLFTQLGGRYLAAVWGESSTFFDNARKFAFEGGLNPFYNNLTKSPGFHLPPDVAAKVVLLFKILGRWIGGALVGALLLLLAFQRRHMKAGLVAASCCTLLAASFGTVATLVPAVGLWIYLRRRTQGPPPVPAGPLRWWAVLLWVVALFALDFALQAGATVFALVPKLVNGGLKEVGGSLRAMFTDGTAFLIFFNADWVLLLALLAICRPQTHEGWQERLGLRRCGFLSSALWIVVAGLVFIGIGSVLSLYKDEKTKLALELIRLGVHSPVIFFLATAVAAPVVEELVFRGYAYSAWVGKFGAWGAAAATSLLFALCHLQYGWYGILAVFFLGLTLAFLRWKTGSVYPGMVLHMLNNAIVGLVFCFTPPGS